MPFLDQQFTEARQWTLRNPVKTLLFLLLSFIFMGRVIISGINPVQEQIDQPLKPSLEATPANQAGLISPPKTEEMALSSSIFNYSLNDFDSVFSNKAIELGFILALREPKCITGPIKQVCMFKLDKGFILNASEEDGKTGNIGNISVAFNPNSTSYKTLGEVFTVLMVLYSPNSTQSQRAEKLDEIGVALAKLTNKQTISLEKLIIEVNTYENIPPIVVFRPQKV